MARTATVTRNTRETQITLTIEMCIRDSILSTYRADQKFTHEEARLLDLCLLVHADHGGGNCSTFTCRVLSSSGTDTYAAISSAIGALKGPKHGGANLKVMHQLDYILENVEDPSNDDEVREFLRKRCV